jgi:hypothetical protein
VASIQYGERIDRMTVGNEVQRITPDRKPAPMKRTDPNGPVHTARVQVWATARQIARGRDVRCVPGSEGEVLIVNGSHA